MGAWPSSPRAIFHYPVQQGCAKEATGVWILQAKTHLNAEYEVGHVVFRLLPLLLENAGAISKDQAPVVTEDLDTILILW